MDCQTRIEEPPATAALSCWGLKPMAGPLKPCRGAPKLQYHKKDGCGIQKEGGAKCRLHPLIHTFPFGQFVTKYGTWI